MCGRLYAPEVRLMETETVIESRIGGFTPRRRKLTVSELAAEYGVSRDTIYRLVQSGSLPVIRIGYSLRFDSEAVEHALTSDMAIQTMK
jgi:excisionase family DNA binding protein